MAYADIEKRRAWFRRRYQKRHEWELERAARYRQNKRRLLRKRQREWMRRKLLEDPAWRCRIGLQTDWKRRCWRKGVFHSEPFLELLGMPWEQFSRRLERQFKRCGWDWSDYGSEFTIDHRLPRCAFDLHKAEQRAMCSHRSNLQVLSLDENRRKNGGYSKVELRCFKTLWRSRYGRMRRQLRLFKESRQRQTVETPF